MIGLLKRNDRKWLDNEMNDTYSFAGSSGRAVACPVTRYALYSAPHRGEENSAATRWTGPDLSSRFPGVVKSGLVVSEWGWSSEKMKWADSRNVERGRSFQVIQKELTTASRFLYKLISNREVSELVVSFEETMWGNF